MVGRKEQMPFRINDTFLVESLDQPRPSIAGDSCFKASYNTTHSEVWFQRGWTYQEGALSQRQLVFTQDEVHWRCRSALWREESSWEPSSEVRMYDPIIPDFAFEMSHVPDFFNFSRMYEYTVSAYTLRNLSHASDGLNAVMGIFQAFERYFNESFFWALPESSMTDALIWQALEISPRTTRNVSHLTKLKDGSLVNVPFPSWSWVGWTTQINYNVEKVEGLVITKFYQIGSDGLPQVFDAEKRRTDKAVYHADWIESITTITAQDLPPSVTSFPRCLSLLCFWSSTALFTIYHRTDGYSPRIRELFEDENMSVSDYSFLDFPLSDVEFESISKFVVIGVTEENYVGRRRLYVLMTAEHDGLCYRWGILELWESAWIGFRTRKWEFIALA